MHGLDDADKNMSAKSYPFRLQVWSDQGKLIFEQPLQHEPKSWNIHKTKEGCDFVFEQRTERNFADEFNYIEMITKTQ